MSSVASIPNRPSVGLVSSTWLVARRAVLRYLRTPKLIVLSALQMAMFLVFFRYVFGGAISSLGLSYVDFLVPGFITTGVLFVGIGTSIAMAEDMQEGFIDRLRSMPIPRSAVLTGRSSADLLILIWSNAIAVAVSFAIGFRLHGTLLEGLAAFGLCVLFGYAFEWLFIALGQFAGNPQAAQGVSFLVFPLAFISSAYVPTSTLPSWLAAFARHQPFNPMIGAVRALTLGPDAARVLGHSPEYFVLRSLIWTAGVIAVSLTLAVVSYRRR
ncbi:MAG TPA: ABC transporter permease [Thermomicrobiaceae bacterium]|nr:ABC transporter permease [Thermomicrobiaceae bacterium]